MNYRWCLVAAPPRDDGRLSSPGRSYTTFEAAFTYLLAMPCRPSSVPCREPLTLKCGPKLRRFLRVTKNVEDGEQKFD